MPSLPAQSRQFLYVSDMLYIIIFYNFTTFTRISQAKAPPVRKKVGPLCQSPHAESAKPWFFRFVRIPSALFPPIPAAPLAAFGRGSVEKKKNRKILLIFSLGGGIIPQNKTNQSLEVRRKGLSAADGAILSGKKDCVRMTLRRSPFWIPKGQGDRFAQSLR